MKNRLSAVAATAFFLLTAPGYTQETTSSASQNSGGMMGGMKMGDMMQQCRTLCQQMSTSMDDLTTTVKQAMDSNDPAQMRDALEKTHASLTRMQEKMSSCRSKMDMMQKMHSGGGMGMMQGMGAEKKE